MTLNAIRCYRAWLPSLFLGASGAMGQGLSLRLQPFADVPSPVLVASNTSDPTRLYVASVQQRIWTVRVPGGVRVTTPFLMVPSGSANGILGMAFHPDAANNRTFYVSYQANGMVTVVSGRLSSTDPDLAEAATTLVGVFPPLFTAVGDYGQHTGGWIAFGNDGYLYLPLGDASFSTAAQDLQVLGGKVLRLDVDGPDNIPGNTDDDAFPDEANRNYSIPPDNPYAGGGGRPEIWARGVRNPYRGSIDRETGDLWFGDVGQNLFEEVDRLPAGLPARNLGWPMWEGTRCTTGCVVPNLIAPILAYPQGGAVPIFGRSVIGGVVYRGCAIPQLTGTFLFADYYSPWIAGVRVVGGSTILIDRVSSSADFTGVAGIGADAAGEVYVANLNRSQVLKLVPNITRDGDANGVPDACEGRTVCRSDFNGDGGVTIDDLLGFLGAYAAGSTRADYDDGSGTGLFDGAVGVEDLIRYLTLYEAGC